MPNKVCLIRFEYLKTAFSFESHMHKQAHIVSYVKEAVEVGKDYDLILSDGNKSQKWLLLTCGQRGCEVH